MATKTTKKTTTRKPAAKKTVAQNKLYKVIDTGTETDYKTKYHFMCVCTIVFAVICGLLFWALCNKQMDYEDDLNCVATDPNCTIPNKRADEGEDKGGDTSYYNADTVEQNAVSAAGQE